MTTKKIKKEIIIGFDLDGTLINSIPLHLESSIFAANSININITKKDFFGAQSTTAEDMIRKVKPNISNEDLKIFLDLKKDYFHKNISKINVFDDTIKTLKKLHEIAKIIIISNTTYIEILKYLEHSGLNPLFFDVIVGRDLVKHPKPYPDEIIITEKIEHHKLDYFIGDSTVDLITGKKAGVKTIGVATGFNSKEELIKEKPFKVIDNLFELVDIIKN